MQTLRDIAPYLALVAGVLALVLLALVVVLWTRVRRLRRAQVVVMGRHGERDLVAHADSLDSQVRNLRDAVEILTDELDDQKRQLDHALTNRAIVRYDAFRDAGGEQSASFALLDEYRSGVVFSAIAARDFARIYVKHLTEGAADRELSPEEQRAVAAAVPRPLTPGEEGRRAARAALPDLEPRMVGGGERVDEAPADGAISGAFAAGTGAPLPGEAAPETPAPEETGPETPDEGAGARAGLEAEATFAPGPAEPGTADGAAVVEAALDEVAPPDEAAPPLQPLLDDDAFTWHEGPPARQEPSASPTDPDDSATPDGESPPPPS